MTLDNDYLDRIELAIKQDPYKIPVTPSVSADDVLAIISELRSLRALQGVDGAFYKLTVTERDVARRQVERLEEERDALRAEIEKLADLAESRLAKFKQMRANLQDHEDGVLLARVEALEEAHFASHKDPYDCSEAIRTIAAQRDKLKALLGESHCASKVHDINEPRRVSGD